MGQVGVGKNGEKQVGNGGIGLVEMGGEIGVSGEGDRAQEISG